MFKKALAAFTAATLLSLAACKTAEASSPIQHVIVIVQENRTVDNLFQFFPGANTQNYCVQAGGGHRALTSKPLEANVNPSHSHTAFVVDYNGGANNVWADAKCSYVPQSEVQEYYTLASTYTFADNFFQTNQGPSFPAHQYLIEGKSTCDGALTDKGGTPVPQCAPPTPYPMAENPGGGNGGNAGCNAPKGTYVSLISPTGDESASAYPCSNPNSILNEVWDAGLSWKYYQNTNGSDIWHAPSAIQSLYCFPYPYPCSPMPSAAYTGSVSYPSSQFLTDIAAGTLAEVTYITPSKLASDHAGETDGTGPAWVASIVNSVCASPYWSSTAIILTWDDWGGLFDHVVPPTRNSYELGYRVPFLLISPYARSGKITHNQYDFGSILKFIEHNWDLPSLNSADAPAADFTADLLDYTQQPLTCSAVPSKHKAEYFIQQDKLHPDTSAPDHG